MDDTWATGTGTTRSKYELNYYIYIYRINNYIYNMIGALDQERAMIKYKWIREGAMDDTYDRSVSNG